MSENFLAEIRIMSFNFAPQGWAMCNGQFLPINQNQALFSLLGTTYGGNGQTTFALPDLRNRVPIHMGNGHTEGETGGQQAHTLSTNELPMHVHSVMASNTKTTVDNPLGNVLGNSNPNNIYGPAANFTPLSPATLSPVGGSQAHQNMQPYLVLNFCINLVGIFPSQN